MKLYNIRRIFLPFLVFCLISAAASAAPAELVPFDRWASGADVYYFTSDDTLFGAAGSIGAGGSAAAILSELPEAEFRPVSRQRRIAGFAENADRLVIGINCGYPIFLDEESGIPERPRPGVRSGFLEKTGCRTLGNIFADGDELIFHYYNDRTLGAASPDTPELRGLLRMSFDSGGKAVMDELPLGFGEDNPEWEPVELVSAEGGWLAAWKYTDDKKTRFRYIKHDESGRPVEEIDEKYFRDGYALVPFDEGGFELRGFLRAAREGVLGRALGSAGDIFLRLSADDAAGVSAEYPACFHDSAQAAGSRMSVPRILPASRGDRFWFVLDGDRIIRCGGNLAVLSLPDLPPGFRYRELWAGRGMLILGWEESEFPEIGRAGMMLVRMRDTIE